MIVDTHVHVWEIDPPRYPVGPTAPNWTSLPDEPGTAEELLADMDSQGVDWSVLVQTSWSTWDNGYIADSVARYPHRFVGHGLLDPLDQGNIETGRYWLQQRGLAGFRFHPMYYPEEQVLLRPHNLALWEELASLDAVLQFHLRPGDAEQIGYIARHYPGMPLILDHLAYPEVDRGQAYIQPILELAQHDNVYLKLSDVAGRSRQEYPYEDMHSLVRTLVSAFGAQRTVWGTGYPGHHRTKHSWPTLDMEIRLIREGLPFLGSDDREWILGKTAANLWGLAERN